MVQFGEAPNLICWFSHCFVCLENQLEEKGKRKIQINSFTVEARKWAISEWKRNYGPWHFFPSFHSHCSYIRQLHFTWRRYPRKSRTSSVSISTTHRKYNWSLTGKKEFLKSWVPVFVHKQLFGEDKLTVLVKYSHLDMAYGRAEPFHLSTYVLENPGLVCAHRVCKVWSLAMPPACHLCHQQHPMTSTAAPASPSPSSATSLDIESEALQRQHIKHNSDQCIADLPFSHTLLGAL